MLFVETWDIGQHAPPRAGGRVKRLARSRLHVCKRLEVAVALVFGIRGRARTLMRDDTLLAGGQLHQCGKDGRTDDQGDHNRERPGQAAKAGGGGWYLCQGTGTRSEDDETKNGWRGVRRVQAEDNEFSETRPCIDTKTIHHIKTDSIAIPEILSPRPRTCLSQSGTQTPSNISVSPFPCAQLPSPPRRGKNGNRSRIPATGSR